MTISPVNQSINGKIISTEVAQCINPECLKLNLEKTTICQYCGEKLLLKERYRAVKYLGKGGFTYTFVAVDEHCFDYPCLIKQFVPQKNSREYGAKVIKLLQQEAATLKYLDYHPQIPKLLAFFIEEEKYYLIAELMIGQDLLQLQQQTGAFSQSQVRHILTELLRILEFIHQRQVVHRDLKPSNLILRQDNSLALIDFGAAILSNSEFPQLTSIVGTPGYAAPEQLQGQVYPASDLYSLGATAWQLLTGTMPPETGISPEKLWRFSEVNLEQNFIQIITKLLQSDWRDRYQSALEVLEDLNYLDRNNLPDLTKNSFDNKYQELVQLLAEREYLLAEQETWQLILKIAQRESQACLTLTDILNFPDWELKTIDRLWQEYSEGNFGLTVQQEIYTDLVKTERSSYDLWQNFARKIGWYRQNKWLNYEQLNFTLTAPKGHLPVCCLDVFNRAGIDRQVCNWWRTGFLALREKLI